MRQDEKVPDPVVVQYVDDQGHTVIRTTTFRRRTDFDRSYPQLIPDPSYTSLSQRQKFID